MLSLPGNDEMAEVKLWHTNGNAENLTLHQYLSSRPGGVKYMKHSFPRQQQDLRCRDGINICLGTMLFKSVFQGCYNDKTLGYWSICLKSNFLLGVFTIFTIFTIARCFHHFLALTGLQSLQSYIKGKYTSQIKIF